MTPGLRSAEGVRHGSVGQWHIRTSGSPSPRSFSYIMYSVRHASSLSLLHVSSSCAQADGNAHAFTYVDKLSTLVSVARK